MMLFKFHTNRNVDEIKHASWQESLVNMALNYYVVSAKNCPMFLTPVVRKTMSSWSLSQWK